MDSPAQLDSASRYTATDRYRLLQSLSVHPAFVFYCERQREKITKDIDAKVWDVETPDGEVRILREVRARLTRTYDPAEIVATLIATAENEADQEKS